MLLTEKAKTQHKQQQKPQALSSFYNNINHANINQDVALPDNYFCWFAVILAFRP